MSGSEIDGNFYLGKKSAKQGYWTSFETDSKHSIGKKMIYGRCVPCIENLLNQLIEGKKEIELGNAFNCWKVVAVLDDEQECLKVLQVYERRYLPSRYIRGRFGSREETGTKAVVIHVDSENERDSILSELEQCALEVNKGASVFYSRACEYVYGEVLGDWKEWMEVTPVKYPENISKVIEIIKEALYK
jgi:hypothetical protein